MAKDGLTKEQVEHIAKLANLPLEISETETFREQLSGVVNYIEKISNIKYKQGLTLRQRRSTQISKISEERRTENGKEDIADTTKCLSQEDALSGTESKHNGLFVTTAIFKE